MKANSSNDALPTNRIESDRQISETKEESQEQELDRVFAEYTDLERGGVKTADEISELEVLLENNSSEKVKQLEAKLADLGVPSLSEEAKNKITSNNVDGAIGLETRRAEKFAVLAEVLKAAGKIEGKTALAKELSQDPRFQKIIEDKSLQYLKNKDAQWFKDSVFSGEVGPSGYLLDKKGNETNFLPSQNISGGWEEVQASARSEFDKNFAEDAKTYAEQDRVKIYENPNDDPVIKQVERAITEAANKEIEEDRTGKWGDLAQREAEHLDVVGVQERAFIHAGMREWQNFVLKYPEKAAAYKNTLKPIERALGAQASREKNEARKKAERERRQQAEAADGVVFSRYLGMHPVDDVKQGAQEVVNSYRERLAVNSQEETLDKDKTQSQENYEDELVLEEDIYTDGEDVGVCIVDNEFIVGSMAENKSSSFELKQARQTRVEKMAAGFISEGNEGKDATKFAASIENTFTSGAAIELKMITGPEGPVFVSKKGEEIVAASKLAEMPKILASVEDAKEPNQMSTTEESRADEWKQMIKRGLIKGEVVDEEDGSFVLNIKKQVLPWCSAKRSDFFTANISYKRVYPSTFEKMKSFVDDKLIPEEVFMDKTGTALNLYLYEPDKLNKYIEELRQKVNNNG